MIDNPRIEIRVNFADGNKLSLTIEENNKEVENTRKVQSNLEKIITEHLSSNNQATESYRPPWVMADDIIQAADTEIERVNSRIQFSTENS